MTRSRRMLVVAAWGAGVLGVGLVVAWLVAGAMLGPPAWYAPAAADDAAADELGERIEYRLVEELQRVRPPAERWTVRLTDVQANAWLAARLPAWWRTETGEPWPEDLRPPQLRSGGEQLTLVLAADLPGLEAGLVAVVRPASGAAIPAAGDRGLGRVGLSFAELRLGRTGASAMAVSDFVIDAAGARGRDAETLRATLADPAAALDRAVESIADRGGAEEGDGPGLPIRLADGRRVRLESVGLEVGAMTLTFRSAGPGAGPAAGAGRRDP